MRSQSLSHCKLLVVKITHTIYRSHMQNYYLARLRICHSSLIVDLIVLAAGPTLSLVSSYTAVLVLVLELPSEILIPALAMASISDVGGESYSMSMSSS